MGEDIGEKSVAYSFKKQLEEADLLLLNKTDLLAREGVAEIGGQIGRHFPGMPVIEISGLNEWNIDKWAEHIMNHESSIRDLEIDMKVVMDGCEETGWYNKAAEIRSDEEVDIKAICEGCLQEIRDAFAAEGKELLHLKVHVDQGGAFLKTALTSTAGVYNTVGSLTTFKGTGRMDHIDSKSMQRGETPRFLAK